MSLIGLVYISFANNMKMSEDELKEILVKAREKNEKHNVTGMLLYRNGFFIQALEGEGNTVAALFDVIRDDPRHTRVMVLYKNKIVKRNFDNWSMGFHVIDDETLKSIDGFQNLVNQPFTTEYFKSNPGHVMTLLNAYRNI